MKNPAKLESFYKKYKRNIGKWLPDGVIEVDLELLHRLDLLHYHSQSIGDSPLTRYFHVVESEEKLTLANDDFIVWIVPDKIEEIPVTYTLIALNRENEIQLELAFTTRGVYNNSHLVLRLLERYLIEIQSTEDLLSKLNQTA